MTGFNDFGFLAGVALIVLALTLPLAWCGVQDRAQDASIKRACIEARGNWETGWGPSRCQFPVPGPSHE